LRGVRNESANLRQDSAASPTAQWDRNLSPLKVSSKREFLRSGPETFGRFSPELPYSESGDYPKMRAKPAKCRVFTHTVLTIYS
jgi:hypothetical protein